jgi:hypothetical protein
LFIFFMKTSNPAHPKPKSTDDLVRADQPIPRLRDPLTAASRNPQSRSTPASPKSTLDLRLALLIWVEKWPASALSSENHRLFSPITTGQWKHAHQKPTDADRKVFAPTLDLACGAEKFHSPLSQIFAMLFIRFR